MGFLNSNGLRRLWAHIVLNLEKKADVDHVHNEIIEMIDTATEEATSHADTGDETTLAAAKAYADEMIKQSAQVQIITWEADD